MSIKSPFQWLKNEQGDPLGLVPVHGEMTIGCDGGCSQVAVILLPEGWSVAAKPQTLGLVRFFCPECRKARHG